MLDESKSTKKQTDLFVHSLTHRKCAICGEDASISTQFHTRSLPNTTFCLCKEHDRDLFLLGESRFIQKYNHLFHDEIINGVNKLTSDSWIYKIINIDELIS